MELDQLKEMWSNENVRETPLISLEKQKEIHLPLEKIRKNMRGEFWSSVFIFAAIILFLIFKEMYFFKFKFYVITLVSAMLLVTAFYFFKFFSLYKNITTINLNTTESLRDLDFQFKLNEQYYLSFYISFVPCVVAEMLLIFEITPRLKEMQGLEFVLYFLGVCFLMLFTLYIVGKFWFKTFYGKYISQIKKIADDLK